MVSTGAGMPVDSSPTPEYRCRVATFTVGTNDSLWPIVCEAYKRIVGGTLRQGLEPNHEIEVEFSVHRVSSVGEDMEPWLKSAKPGLIVHPVPGHPIHAAALKFAAENGGAKNLNCAAIKITAIRVHNQ